MLYAVNNTVDDCNAGISAPYGQIVAINNIVGTPTYTDGRTINIESKGGAILDYNYLNGTVLEVQVVSGQIITDFATYQATGLGANSINSTDAGLGVDYTPTVSSVCRDAGTTSSVYATFLSLYGLAIDKDINGTPAPSGTARDIGAIEYSA
jgi:hypothetical protein